MTNYRHHSPAREPCPEPAAVKPLLPAFFLRKDVNSRSFMRVPPPGLDETHILPKSGHLVSTERHLSSKTPCFTVCALIFLVKIGKLSHSRTKRLVSALPESTLFTVVPFDMRSTLEQFGHFRHTMKITRYLRCVRSPLLETLVNSVQIKIFKNGRFVSTECHLCSKPSCFTVSFPAWGLFSRLGAS